MRPFSLIATFFLGLCLTQIENIEGQFNPFDIFRQTFRGAQQVFQGPRFRDDGTKAPQSTGKDEVFPRDCGRETDTGRGKLCFPDGLLCQSSK